MIKQASLTLAAMILSVPLVAQLPAGQTAEPKAANLAVMKAMGVKFTAAKCSPKGDNHYLVSSVKTYFNSYFMAKEDADKAKFLRTAVTVSKDAILNKGQDKNGGAWYWLGRIYLQQGDVPGADTALTKAEAFLPDCGQEIKAFRQTAFTAIVAPAVELQRNGKNDSAAVLYHQANLMSRDSPTAFLGLAIIASIATPPQVDTAIAYYKLVQVKSVGNPQYTKERDASASNLVSLYMEKGMETEAIAEARKLVTWNPGDLESKRPLYSILARSTDAANQAEAKTIQTELLAAAEATGNATASDLARMGFDQFQAKNYTKAAEYFEKALVKEPWRRDILGNKINVYFALQDYAKMIPDLNIELLAEPMNTNFYKLLINASQKADTAKTLAIATAYFTLVTGLETQPLIPTATGATVQATAVGMEGADPKTGKPLPPAPVTIVVEFLDMTGAVIGTTEVTIPALKTNEESQVKIEGVGKGIADWRYHIKK